MGTSLTKVKERDRWEGAERELAPLIEIFDIKKGGVVGNCNLYKKKKGGKLGGPERCVDGN